VTRRGVARSQYIQLLGAHLRGLRRERGLKTTHVANGFGVSIATLSKIEAGTRAPSTVSLAVYCDALEADMLRLLGDVADRYRQEADPFGLLGHGGVPAHLRALDGLALFVDLPARFLPSELHHVEEFDY
jgi:transcriptional regulator with XRE-family HTH domain